MTETDAVRRNNVTVTGPAGARTILFAHGFGSDQRAWDDVAARFEGRFRVVRFDNVGAGNADPAAYSPLRYASLEAYAEDLVEVCHAAGVTDAVLVGHSVSSMVVMLAAILDPAIAERLVLLGASPRYLDDEGYRGGFRQSDLDGIYAAMESDYYTWASGFSPVVMAHPDRPHLAGYLARNLETIRPDIALAVLRAIMQSDLRACLPKVDKPTLILQTADDPVVPDEVGDYLAAHIPGGSLRRLGARGHLPHVAAPDEVASAIEAFL
ncbi:MAG: alpha/beta hydrolase [Armatimonadetes bacterium]|nr:alpha/beta hydrolase [Armatimonadota bacterium]